MTDRTEVASAYTKEQAALYDRTRFESAVGKEIHRVELAIVMRILKSHPKSASVLEVGCGTGRILLECLKEGYSLAGVDASDDMLEKLTQKLGGHLSAILVKRGDAANLPFGSDTFDFVYAIRLLNQTESEEYALKVVEEMVRVVKPGGRILVEAVNRNRPRIGRNRSATVRLSWQEIAARAMGVGAEVLKVEGAFFLGMGSIGALGQPFVRLVSTLDRLLARLWPTRCARIYVSLRKR